jgi:hypothetical protein
MGIIVFPIIAYGQTPSELSYRLIPNKILQNSEGILQVYSNGESAPTNIENLVATSSDSSVIQILGIEPDKNNFITDVKIKTGSSGKANIALAAPGFTSQEFPITVYNNDAAPSKLLIKTTPSTFSTTGHEQGYVSVEFVNNANLPTRVTKDTTVTLSTSNSDILTLTNNELIIKKGDYFATGQFVVKKDGSAQISASAPTMQTVSSTVTVSTVGNQQSIQLFVYPTKINDYANSNAYVIVQLQDSAGNTVQATNDIPVSVQITDTSNSGIVNTSTQTALMSSDESLVIKKGSYWGYSKLVVNAGTTDMFSLSVSAKGYVVPLPVSLTPTPGQLYDTKSAKLDLLPILATGHEELVGILHLEDNNGNPVIASSNFLTEIDSSDPSSLSINKIQMGQGDDASLVFGKVGTTISNSVTLNVITQNTETLSPTITLPTQKTYTLVAESLIPQVMSHDTYPTAVYMLDSNNALTAFQKDLNTFITPNDYVQIESKLLSKDQSIVLLNSQSLKEGTTTVSLMAGDYQSNIQVNNLSSKPSSIFVDYPSKILSNLGNTFSMQLLNSQQLPVFADHNMNLKLVSSNPSILNVPDSVTIKKGEYYSLFDVTSKNVGTTELAVLSDELPLAKYDIDITNLNPDVTISSTDYVDQNVVLNAKVTAQYHGVPLSQMKVDWQVKGATIQKMDSITDKDGTANLSVLVQDPTAVDIQTSVSGGVYGTTSAEKSVKVNPPLVSPSSSTTGGLSNTNSFNILGLNPLFVIIPVAAAAAGGLVVLKKKNMLDGITEKISIMEKITEVKDRLSQMREK